MVASENHVELRIYDNFAEVREEIDISSGFATVTFHQTDYQNVLEDSIKLEIVSGRVSTSITEQNHSFEGKKVFVRNEKTDKCKEVLCLDFEQQLVQDCETGRFYYVHGEKLEFPEAPLRDFVRVQFKIHDPSTTDGILTYFDTRIKWKPVYQLDVLEKESKASIKCWAVISNPGKQNYTIDKAELFGGEVRAMPTPIPRARMTNRAAGFCLMSAAPDMCDSPEIDIGQHREIGGLFQYTISKPFTLSARSKLYEEFLEAIITPKFWSAIDTVNERNEDLKFTRFYEITSNQFLPAGKMSIREQGRFISDVRLDSLPAGVKREIRIGEDSSGFARRKTSDHQTNGKVTTIQIEIEIQNSRDHPWEYRYKERSVGHDADFTYSFRLGQEDPDVEIRSNEIRAVKKLEAKGKWKIAVQLMSVKKDPKNIC